MDDCNKTNCPVVATLNMVGGKYKALILWHLAISEQGIKRFGELRKLIPQATQKMLTQQLRELEDDNLIIRTVYPVVPPKVEYRLSELGQSITPILEAMRAWGMDYMKSKGMEANCFMTVAVK
ncbi:MAG: helix-turn-helix transcriptional regulator [Defluviitaleaceae bacterium]|nr:helix-turn-helix transcriptional regulator [Defluviitaleaceae bacterium]